MGSTISQSIVSVYGPVANGLSTVGLDQPYQRAAVGLVLAFAGMKLIEPRFAYQEDGTPKQWSLLADNKDVDPATVTWLPWYLVPVLAAVLFGLFL